MRRTWRVPLRAVCTAFLAGVLLFIFINSAQPANLSAQSSGRMTGLVNGWLHAWRIPLRLTEHAVRKLAHFGEYAALGFWLLCTRRAWTPRVSRALLLLFLVPWADEALQLFVPGRSGQLRDVLLDTLGMLFGTLVACLLVRRLVRAQRKNG